MAVRVYSRQPTSLADISFVVHYHAVQLHFQAKQSVPYRTRSSRLFLIFLCTGVFVASVFAGAFAFGIGFDMSVTKFYDSWNKGVR